ncbi:MAG TPA: hypothetical protein VGA50_03340 [Kiloniellales bacterium]
MRQSETRKPEPGVPVVFLVGATLAMLADWVQAASFSAPVLFGIGRVVEVPEELRACRDAAPGAATDAWEPARNA